MGSSKEIIDITESYGAHNYHPLEVVISEAEGVWAKDVEGKRYLDMLSAYSALNFGHGNPRLLAVAEKQLRRLSLTSRAFYNDQLGPFCKELASFCGMELVLPMNSGAEAVETSLKCARKWGYTKKKIPAGAAEVICFSNNFHGRTTTIVGFSTSESSREGFGPFTPGFKVIPYGDASAVLKAVTPNTCAVLVEPIQGEGGVIIPPEGFLKEVREICTTNNILMIADEVQTGLCRTGKVFCCEHENVRPDLYVLGKSLGGGILPISAVVGDRRVMDVFTAGTHGSTFGGNPLACAIAREVLRLIQEERPHERAAELGAYAVARLRSLVVAGAPAVGAIRARGLMIGVDIVPAYGPAKRFCKLLVKEGVLCKDTRDQTIRFAPPLTITRDELDWGLERICKVFQMATPAE